VGVFLIEQANIFFSAQFFGKGGIFWHPHFSIDALYNFKCFRSPQRPNHFLRDLKVYKN